MLGGEGGGRCLTGAGYSLSHCGEEEGRSRGDGASLSDTGGLGVDVGGGGRHVPLAYFQFLETFGPAELSRFEQSPD